MGSFKEVPYTMEVAIIVKLDSHSCQFVMQWFTIPIIVQHPTFFSKLQLA